MRSFLAVALLSCCFGCSSSSVPLGQVNGVITIDGDPLANAIVTFIPKQGGRPSSGATNSQGEYQLLYATEKGALVGQHDVTIQMNPEGLEVGEESHEAESIYGSPNPVEKQSDDAKARIASMKSQKAAEKMVPEKYRKPGELSAEVKSGQNQINFELKST